MNTTPNTSGEAMYSGCYLRFATAALPPFGLSRKCVSVLRTAHANAGRK